MAFIGVAALFTTLTLVLTTVVMQQCTAEWNNVTADTMPGHMCYTGNNSMEVCMMINHKKKTAAWSQQ